MTEETITLIQPILGMNPFVLIEFHKGDDGPDDLRVGIRHGGGVDNAEDVGAALTEVLFSLPDEANPVLGVLDDLASNPAMAPVVQRIRDVFTGGYSADDPADT